MANPSDVLPSIVNAHQVHLFNFYQDGVVKQGMRYGHHLFGRVYVFDSKNRLAAYDLANQLAETGCQTMITVSKQEYQVWVLLHATEYCHWHKMVEGLLGYLLEDSPANCQLEPEYF